MALARQMIIKRPVLAETPTFTVMSYNILAPHLARKDWFQYVPPAFLKESRRTKQIENEIGHLNADIVCLQECASPDTWRASLGKLGYSMLYKQKTGGKLDGCGTFFKTDKFDEVEKVALEYDSLATTKEEEAELVKQGVGLLAALRFKGRDNSLGNHASQGVIIGNTHLYWNHRYSYVKLRQALHFVEQAKEMSTRHNFPVVLCGDFNMTPDATVLQVLLTGKWNDSVPLNNFTFIAELEEDPSVGLPGYKFTEPEHKAKGIERLAHVKELVEASYSKGIPLLESVYADYTNLVPPDPVPLSVPWTGEPPYTNFTSGFFGTLDYIFVFRNAALSVTPTKILKLPSLQEVTTTVALPNEQFASDHISIMCEFQLC